VGNIRVDRKQNLISRCEEIQIAASPTELTLDTPHAWGRLPLFVKWHELQNFEQYLGNRIPNRKSILITCLYELKQGV
jgi:hypothetical protein